MTPDVLLKQINEHGLSTEQIAKRLGFSVSYIIKLRNGERKMPSYPAMDKIRELHREICHD